MTRTLTVALVGNPNTGKTTLFNALSGMNQRVGNYAGVTVETKTGHCRHEGREFDVLDLPGTYSLAARSPDEMVAVDAILGRLDHAARPDVVVSIVDASNLERNLFLTTQVLDLGVPVVVALNMIDVSKSLGVDIDVPRLEERLGLTIVPMQANKGAGLNELKSAVLRAIDKFAAASAASAGSPRGPQFPPAFETEVATVTQKINNGMPPALARRLLLDVGGQTERNVLAAHGGFADDLSAARARLATAGCGVPGIEARTRYAWIRRATDGCVRRPSLRKITWTDRIDHVLTHWFFGAAIFLAIMLFVFLSIFWWAAPLMDLIAAGFDVMIDLVKSNMDAGPLRSLIVDGILRGVGGVLIFVPQILILFAFLAVLEDCGYMARAAYLMDRIMSRAGLNGKAFIPLLSSVACAVPGIMAARVIENRRDRLATILVAPLMSCSARLPVYSLLVGAFLTEDYPWWVPGVAFFGLYMLGLVLAPLVAFCLKQTMLKGETPPFVMEMPLYKRPSLRAVARRSLEASWMFVRRAGTIILASMIVVWALLYFPNTAPDGESYDAKIASLEASIGGLVERSDELEKELTKSTNDAQTLELAAEMADVHRRMESASRTINQLNRDWKAQSLLGRMGKAIEPAVRPLGWDWQIGVAALASFPAREVFVGVMGIIFGEGDVDAGDDEARGRLAETIRNARDDHGRPIFTVPVALSVLVFFALCAQCASTIAIIRREANSWGWAIFTFVYMTGLAYVGALVTYQVGRLFV